MDGNVHKFNVPCLSFMYMNIYMYTYVCVYIYIYRHKNKVASMQYIVFKDTEGYCKKEQNDLFVSMVDGMRSSGFNSMKEDSD